MSKSTIILNQWRWSRLVLYITSFSNDLFGWLAVCIAYAAWGEKGTLRWEAGVLRAKIKENSWLDSKANWSGLTITAHAVLYRGIPLWPEELPTPHPTQVHEHTHVEQGESANLLSSISALVIAIILAVTSNPVVAVLVSIAWASLMGHLATGLVHKLTAICRGEDHYWGSTHEEAARATAKDS